MIDADSQMIPEDIIVKLDSCLDIAGVPTGRGRVKAVTEGTGYSQGMVSKLLSGKSPITPRFITVVCTSFGINPDWIYKSTEPVLLKNYPLHRLKTALSSNAKNDKETSEEEFCEMLINLLGMKSEEVSLVMAGVKPITLKIAEFAEAEAGIGADWILRGEGSMNSEVDYVRRIRLRGRIYDRAEEFESILKYNGYIREDGSIATENERTAHVNEIKRLRTANEKNYAIEPSQFTATSLEDIFPAPVSEKQLRTTVSNHFAGCDEECTDDLILGTIISDILFHLPHLARHEVLELMHQIWKLRYNHSDSLAVRVADEDFNRRGIKPTTRIKLERIPVEPDEDKTQK